jgi:hypothetical protein
MLHSLTEANRIVDMAIMSRSAGALPGTTDPSVPHREQKIANRIELSGFLSVVSLTGNYDMIPLQVVTTTRMRETRESILMPTGPRSEPVSKKAPTRKKNRYICQRLPDLSTVSNRHAVASRRAHSATFFPIVLG